MMAETFVRQAPTHTADSRFFLRTAAGRLRTAFILRLFHEFVAA